MNSISRKILGPGLSLILFCGRCLVVAQFVVASTVADRKKNDAMLLKVFVSTPPNSISGTMVIGAESQTRDPEWTVDEALKAVVSADIIGSAELQ